MRYFRTEDNTGFKYIHSKDDKVIYIENETANAPQFSLQYGDKLIQIFINDGIYRPERDIEGTPDLFSLSYISDSRDKGQSIFATEAEINIYEDDYFNIDELKTASETEILIKYFEKGSLMWSGFVLPDFFQTGITNVRVLKMVASDRIATLKETSNQTVSDTPIKIIAEALKNTGLDLGINVIAKNDFLQTITIERERIKDISSYDLIRTFMILFNCKIVQYSNKWWIVNKSKLESGYIDYKSYTSEGTFVNSVAFNQKIIPFNQVDTNGERSIRPTASEVSLFLEYGGSKKYPKNWDFEEWNGTKFTDWDSVGLTQILNKKQVDNYTNVGDYYKSNLGSDIDENSLFIETTGYDSRQNGNYITIPHIKSTFVKMPFTEGQTEVSVKFNLTVPHQKMIRVLPLIKLVNINPSMHEYFAIDEDGSVKKAGVGSVNLEGISPLKVGDNSDGEALTTAIQTVWEQTFSFKQEDFNRTRGVNAEIQLLVFKSRMTFPSTIKADVFIHSAEVIFNKSEVTGKGLIFKTKQGGGKFSKSREPETVLFSDKINQGVNGYFYNYKYDDTSIVGLPEEFALASVRERALMFSQARDYFSLSGKIEVNPIAKYTCKDKSFVLVGGESRRKDSSIEIEEIVSQSLESTDYIYTYFDEGKDKAKSVGVGSNSGGSSAGGGGSGGGIDANSHNHPNKEVLDTITQEMLDNALREMLGVDSLEEATDENFFSALRTLAEILKNNETLKALFLSKVDDDTAQGLIKFVKGLEIGNYTTGFLGGGGAFKMINGISHLEVDKLDVRMIATFFELVISKLRHIGGQFILTPASMKCIEVEVVANGYKCFFDRGDNNEVVQEFVVNDQARCQVFSGSGLKMYWRLVVEVGDDYIVLSDTDKIEGSSIPEVGDDIVQLGYRGVDKPERTSAMVLSTVGIDAPSFKQYKGIVTYTLEGKETTALTGTGNRLAGDTIFIQDKSLDTVLEEIERANKAPIIRDGYWYEWNPESTEEDKYEPTGVKAEGIKGDGVQQKFLSADEKPEKPIGDAVGWGDVPSEEDSTDVPLVPVGDNLHSRSYLISLGWASFPTYVEANSSVPDNNIIDPSKFKPNTQYLLEYDMSGGTTPLPYLQVKIVYTDSTVEYSPDIVGSAQFTLTTAIGKTVQSIEITKKGWTAIFDNSSVMELGAGPIQAKPIWTIFRNITNGVASEWSEPVKWLGEGTPGKDGKDGKDGSDGVGLPGNDGNDGVTPHVGANGNWYIGSQDTGVPARGPAGSGRGIISIREQFYIHTSGTIPPGTTWTWLDSMPKKTEADEGKFLWIRIKTIFTDDSTPDYSSPRVYEEWGIKDYVEKSAYLLEALREHPKVTTGLLLSKVIGMFDINDDVTAYMNGNPTLNPNAFASGVENFGQQGLETAKAVIRHDGSSKFTDTEIEGKVTATEGSFSGRVSVPFKSIADVPDNQVLNLSDNFNLALTSQSVKTAYLPVDAKYNGVTCHIYNAGLTTNQGSIRIKIQGNKLFKGRKITSQLSEIEIQKGQVGVFICIESFGWVEWACTNYSDLILP